MNEEPSIERLLIDAVAVHLGLDEVSVVGRDSRRDIFESLGIAFAYVVNGRIQWASPRLERLLGYPGGQMKGVGLATLVAIDSQAARVLEADQGIDDTGGSFEIKCRLRRRDGSSLWAKVFGSAVDPKGPGRGSLWAFEDMTHLQEAIESLRLTAAIFETSNEGLLISDQTNRILMVNPAFSRITGYSADEVIGKDPSMLASGRHDKAFYGAMWKEILAAGFWRGELWNRRKNGEIFVSRLAIRAIRNDDGAIDNYLGVFSDITRHKQDQEMILYQANYDALTDMPNRQLLQDRVNQAVHGAGRSEGQVGVLYLDLDNFKVINDGMGHGAGDALLADMATRMRACLRERDTIGRLGGDEFLVLLPHIRDADESIMVARRLLDAVSRPMRLEGRDHEIVMTASIGIAMYPKDGTTAADLVRNADTAAFHAKQRGRNNFQFFTDDMNAQALERLQLEHRLRHALERQEFHLLYQPKVELRHGRVSGVEALVRWVNEEDGLVSPVRFIPIAEDTGLIISIGEWVLRTACAQTKAWLDSGLPPMRTAVNLSARQLARRDLVDMVARVLEETGLSSEYLELEITESTLMERVDDTMSMLRELRAMGIHLAVDDFGTGYSSLSYLKDFPIDALKIDRSFVMEIGNGGGGEKLAAAVIAIGQSLGLKVIAEGVENTDQLAFLRQQWCDEIQGYFFSKPLPADQFDALVRSNRRLGGESKT